MRQLILLMAGAALNAVTLAEPAAIRFRTPHSQVEVLKVLTGVSDAGAIQRKAREFRRSSSATLLIAYFAPSGYDAFAYDKKGVDHTDMEGVVHRVNALGTHNALAQSVAQLICFSSSCQLRYRLGREVGFVEFGERTHPVVDILRRARLELLQVSPHFLFGKTPPQTDRSGASMERVAPLFSIEFFLRADPRTIQSSNCAELACRVRKVLRVETRVVLRMREDAWFAEEPSFPLVYAFDQTPLPPPEIEIWKRRASASCSCPD